MLFATIFMAAFVLLGGVVLYLSKTIDHGEARFDSTGKEIKDEPQQLDKDKSTKQVPDQVNDDE